MAPKKRKSRLSKGKAVADRAGDKKLKRTDEKESKREREYRQEPSKRKNVRVASSLTPSTSHEDRSGRERKTNDIFTPGRKYTSHFRSETMATGSSPSLLDLTVTYDYSTDVNLDDADLPRPTMQQLTQLFPFKDRSEALSSTNNVLSILHGLSPTYSAPPTKRAKLRAACETTPPSSGHPTRSKLDILLTQLQQRLSEVNQEDPLSTDADYQSKFPESESESNIDARVEKGQEMKDNQDEIATEKLESLDSSDNEEMLFWTQAATELEGYEVEGDDPLLRDANEKAKTDESLGINSTFDLNQAWDTEADDFIDQLLITGAEGETISSSPDPIPDTSVPTPNTCNALTNPSIRMQPDIPTSSSKKVQSVSQATVCSKMTADIRTSAGDGDRCPTPPLPLTAAQSSLSKLQANSIRSILRRSPRRPPSWRLAKEDARSTPPLSPLTGEEKQSPLQLVGASSSQTGLATVSWGQSSYGKDNLRTPGTVNEHVCSSGTGSVHNTQGCASHVHEEKISHHTQPIMASHGTDTSDAASGPAVYSRGSVHIPSTVHNTTRPVANGLFNSRGHAQSADSGVSSTSSWKNSRGYTSGLVYSTQTVPHTLDCAREKNSPSKKSANLDLKYTTGTTSSMGTDHRPLAKPVLQSTTSCSLQHSNILPAKLTISSNTTRQQVKENYHPTPAINVRPVTSSAVTSVHQCSQAEIERKRNLARSKLQAKKIASLRNSHH